MTAGKGHASYVYALVLVVACSQWSVPMGIPGLRIPAATLVLFGGACLLLPERRRGPPFIEWGWPQALLLSALTLGLLGLCRPDLMDAAKELIQVVEIFVISWFVFSVWREDAWRPLVSVWGALGGLLLLLLLTNSHDYPPFGLSDATAGAMAVMALPFLLVRLKGLDGWKRWCGLVLLGSAAALGFDSGGLLLSFLAVLVVGSLMIFRDGWARTVSLAALLAVLAWWSPLSASSPWESLAPDYDGRHLKRLYIEYEAALKGPARYPLGSGLGQYKRTINVLRQEVNAEPSPEENVVPRNANNQYLLTLVEAGVPAALALLVCLGAAGWGMFRGWQRAEGEARDRCAVVCAALLGLFLTANFCVVLAKGIGIWVGALLGLAARLSAREERPRSPVRWGLPVVIAAGMVMALLLCNTHVDPVEHVSELNQAARRWLGLRGPGVLLANRDSMEAEVRKRGGSFTDGGLEIVALQKADGGVGADKPAALRLEGESFHSATGKFGAVPANDASGDRVLEIPLGSGKGVGEARYEIEVPAPGSYELYAYVYWHDSCSNSLGFTIGTQTATVASEVFKTWHELRCRRAFNLSKGPTTILVRNLEDGVRLDYFTLVNKP